jgi:NAD(P)-dependent dehydrogenase (short-subunit alcohol dehydrogenase family)
MSDKKKVALVTGANKSIGFETARQLAQQGFTVLLGARNEERGRAAEAELRAEELDVRFIPLDVDDAATHEQARQFIEAEFGKLDVLVNNAAIYADEVKDGKPVQAGETSLDVYRKTFDTNFFNLIALTQALLPLVKKSDAGRIVNLSSILGSLNLHSDPTSMFYDFKVPAYNISKTALNAFTVHLAYELKDTKVKVNSAHPGYVDTDMNGHQGSMPVEDGAKTSVQLATLPVDGPSGRFFHMGEELPW